MDKTVHNTNHYPNIVVPIISLGT
ncbi:hypothetical protein FRAHR75_1380007 [Frankia sp. Hr75.2]|nr:hypothetical protein FRAHR75_1380007 [Frankia sp. Hr75.2]